MSTINSIQSGPSPFTHGGRFLAALLILHSSYPALQADEQGHNHGPGSAGLPKTLRVARSSDVWPAKLPRLPKGVVELKFGDFFVRPVGPRELALTDKLRGLDGRRVRILGYMAQEESPVPGQFLLAPIPVQIHSHDNSLADDLPPSALHVISPAHRGRTVPFTPQLLLLTGALELGNRPEPNGRISIARLTLDPSSTAKWKDVSSGARSGKGAAGLMKAGGAGR